MHTFDRDDSLRPISTRPRQHVRRGRAEASSVDQLRQDCARNVDGLPAAVAHPPQKEVVERGRQRRGLRALLFGEELMRRDRPRPGSAEERATAAPTVPSALSHMAAAAAAPRARGATARRRAARGAGRRRFEQRTRSLEEGLEMVQRRPGATGRATLRGVAFLLGELVRRALDLLKHERAAGAIRREKVNALRVALDAGDQQRRGPVVGPALFTAALAPSRRRTHSASRLAGSEQCGDAAATVAWLTIAFARSSSFMHSLQPWYEAPAAPRCPRPSSWFTSAFASSRSRTHSAGLQAGGRQRVAPRPSRLRPASRSHPAAA